MKIILLRHVEGLGREGEVKDVSDGYARNYLFPRGFADLATPQLIEQLEGQRKHQEKKAKRELFSLEKLASAIEGKKFEIAGKASKEGTLYAAVNNKNISEELKKHGYNIHAENIMTKGLKSSGEHEVIIRFDHGIESRIFVVISPL